MEGEAGYFRRNHWVPVPPARDLEDLNRQLQAACEQDQRRTIAGREQSIGAGMRAEQAHLLPLPHEGFDLAEVSFPKVDGSGCVRVRTNFYSAPLPADTQVQAKIYADRVEIWHEGVAAARQERSYGRYQQVLELEHYLEVLERKPGALAGSTALKQWRERGRWPAEYDRYGEVLIRRHGKQPGTRQMVELLGLGKEHGHGRLREAVSLAPATGCGDVAAIRYLLTAGSGMGRAGARWGFRLALALKRSALRASQGFAPAGTPSSEILLNRGERQERRKSQTKVTTYLAYQAPGV